MPIFIAALLTSNVLRSIPLTTMVMLFDLPENKDLREGFPFFFAFITSILSALLLIIMLFLGPLVMDILPFITEHLRIFTVATLFLLALEKILFSWLRPPLPHIPPFWNSLLSSLGMFFLISFLDAAAPSRWPISVAIFSAALCIFFLLRNDQKIFSFLGKENIYILERMLSIPLAAISLRLFLFA